MNAPLITVGITCFREGKWLRECWETVLAQTDDRWEAVVVMDGTDHAPTRDIFNQLDHPKLRKYAMPENLGPYATRNKAVEVTATPYHLYLDADDRLPEDAVSRVLDTFERHPQCPLVYGDIQFFGSADTLHEFPPSYGPADYQVPPTGSFGVPLPRGFRKDLWLYLGGFSMALARGAADYDFFIGALEAGVTARHCGSVLFYYRVGNPGKVSDSYRANRHEKYEIIVRRHPQFFRDNRRRHAFLATGYKVSMATCHAAGERRVASHLARKCLQHGMWRNPAHWSIFLAGWLPAPMHRQLYRLARWIRQQFRALRGIATASHESLPRR